jgi:predicted RNA binding protein YcfA (HicA-like mRNA interferase family)
MNSKLPRLNGKDVVKVLAKFNFKIENRDGSHTTLINKQQRHPIRVIVPCHSGELKTGTLSHIISDAQVGREEFLKAAA